MHTLILTQFSVNRYEILFAPLKKNPQNCNNLTTLNEIPIKQKMQANGVLYIECYLHVNGKNIIFKTNKVCLGRCTISEEAIKKCQNLHLNKYIIQFQYLICFCCCLRVTKSTKINCLFIGVILFCDQNSFLQQTKLDR